ncbi:MAG: PspC domain-containing protein [Bacillota bacterium]|jgi:phage shock protein C
MKKLYRSRRDSMIAGVAGGIGEYLQVDPTLIRLCFAGFTLLSCGAGLLLYLIAVIIIPLEDIN